MPRKPIFRTRTTGTIRQIGKAFPVRPVSIQQQRAMLPKVRGYPTGSSVAMSGIVLDNARDGDTAAIIYDRLAEKFGKRVSFRGILSAVRSLNRRRLIKFTEAKAGQPPRIELTSKGKLEKDARKVFLL